MRAKYYYLKDEKIKLKCEIFENYKYALEYEEFLIKIIQELNKDELEIELNEIEKIEKGEVKEIEKNSMGYKRIVNKKEITIIRMFKTGDWNMDVWNKSEFNIEEYKRFLLGLKVFFTLPVEIGTYLEIKIRDDKIEG